MLQNASASLATAQKCLRTPIFLRDTLSRALSSEVEAPQPMHYSGLKKRSSFKPRDTDTRSRPHPQSIKSTRPGSSSQSRDPFLMKEDERPHSKSFKSRWARPGNSSQSQDTPLVKEGEKPHPKSFMWTRPGKSSQPGDLSLLKEDERPHPKSFKSNWTRLGNTSQSRDRFWSKGDNEKILLRPSVTAQRVTKLCTEGKHDEAATYLQNLPLDAQNAVVWNTLIREFLRASRYQSAYKLYVDMKRRGFSPTLQTFTTFFGAFQSLGDWSKHTKMLENVHRLHDSYQQYTEHVKAIDPASPELSVAPVTGYIKILTDAGLYQRMFDVLHAMADEGPLAPNQFTFAALFRGLSWRRATSGGPEAQAAMCARNASDVKLLWRQMLKIAEKNPQFEFDSHLITPAISALASGSPSDQLFAFDIVRDYLGLTKPGETPQPPRVQLSTHLLGEVLYLCNSSQKYRLGVHFFRQVVDHPDNRAIITHRHVETVIRLFAGMSMMGSDEASAQALETLEWLLQEEASARNAGDLRPTITTFSLVLNVCWRNGDWASATRTFELMTGYNPDDFADGSRVKEPEMQKRSPGRNIKLDTPAMAHIAHTALASQELANMRQCLRIIDHIGAERLLHRPKALVDQSRSSQFMNDLEYYLAKLAKDLMEIVDEVVAKEPEMCSEEERERWKKIKSQAKECRRYARPTRTPHTEESPLGSQRGLDATASAVDQEFSVRRTLRPSRL